MIAVTGPDLGRKIKYYFSEDILRLPNIETSLTFSVGRREISRFRMIEHFYFGNERIQTFDFTFGYCMPYSTNTWETVYDMPFLSERFLEDMIDNPYKTTSDSFYFVNNELVIHNKASYNYFREDTAQAKKSYDNRYAHKNYKGIHTVYFFKYFEITVSNCDLLFLKRYRLCYRRF